MTATLKTVVRHSDFGGGLLCIVIGALALYLLSGTRMGSLSAMGAAFLPVWLARILIVLGGCIVMRAFSSAVTLNVSAAMLRPFAVIIGATLFFAAALSHLGFAFTSALTLFVTSFASREFRLKESLLIAVIGAAAATLLFVYLLRLNIAVWPSWMV